MSDIEDHSQLVANRFDDWASTYGDDRISPWFQYYQSIALSKLNIAAGSGYLDVGCGTGASLGKVAEILNNGQACGVDISPKMVEKARKNLDGLNVDIRIANAERLPWPDETFSSILCTASFHHYQNPIQALGEMKRVLRKDGRIVILDSARDVSLAIWLQDRFRRYFERGHIRYYTTIEMLELLSKAGLYPVSKLTTFRKFRDHGKIFTGLMIVQCTK